MNEENKIPLEQYLAQKNLQRLEKTDHNVPEAMKALRAWCVFKTYFDKEKKSKDKFLINCHTGKWANRMDSSTWVSYPEAQAYARSNRGEGLAFACYGSGVTCIDLDKCISDNGEYSEFAKQVLGLAGITYTEKSVSNRGIHIFIKGNFLEGYKNRNDKIGLEVYDNLIMSMTGNIIAGARELGECNAELKNFLREALGKKSIEKTNPPSLPNNQTDREVIERIQRSKKGADFDRLFSGEDIKGDHSVSDFTLLNILAFFTNCDASQMGRIFRSSGLYRTDKEAYLNHSIGKAIRTLSVRPNVALEKKPKEPKKK